MSRSPYAFAFFVPTALIPYGVSFPHHQAFGSASAFAPQTSSPVSASPNENRVCVPARAARFRVCLACATLALATALVPLAATAAAASAAISLSIFAVSAFSVNMYTLPLETFGGARAAFAVSMLVASYGAVQALISYVIGAVVDLHGYMPVTAVGALMPLAACAVLWFTRATR